MSLRCNVNSIGLVINMSVHLDLNCSWDEVLFLLIMMILLLLMVMITMMILMMKSTTYTLSHSSRKPQARSPGIHMWRCGVLDAPETADRALSVVPSARTNATMSVVWLGLSPVSDWMVLSTCLLTLPAVAWGVSPSWL